LKQQLVAWLCCVAIAVQLHALPWTAAASMPL
jgi:hypothetical protein